ncbi:hypothetical protein LRY29_01415 [Candidatus Saccharibacteria bacterium]|nr:hypothetical protein [Candidatus Saccharibacteria bacterium]
MASDQYEIPDFSPLREALDAADAARYTPETQPDAYGFIEAIQNDVDMMREKALASGKLLGRGWLSVMEPFALNTRPSIDRLIELESRVAGKKDFRSG